MRNMNSETRRHGAENDEKDFLQELISAHTIAAGMLESALKNLKLEAGADITVVTRLEKSVNALRRMETMIAKRRGGQSGEEAA